MQTQPSEIMTWVEYDREGILPLERRNVLVMIRPRDPSPPDPRFPKMEVVYTTAATVAVGYIRVHSGGPFFVVPGVPHQDDEITHWCDCLGDDFTAPAWLSRQVIGAPRQQWRGEHINPVTTEERYGHLGA